MPLLAKSKDAKLNIRARTLKEHIDDCLLILSFLEHLFPKAAELSGMGGNFWSVLKNCIIFHDLGKAHVEFQKILEGTPGKWDFQRHELFSIPFVEALFNVDKETLNLMRLVIAGHHKDFETLRNYIKFYEGNESFGALEGIEEKDSFETAFKKNINAQEVLDLLQHYQITLLEISPKPIYGLIHSYIKKPYTQTHKDYLRLLMLFGGLKWCDHLGSAMVENISKIEKQDFEFLRVQQRVLLNNGLDFYDHQKACAKIVGNLILTAPTGSGKTESAFLWLEKQLESNGQGRLFYVLPFTASINAMYERVNKAIGGNTNKVGMIHGKLAEYLNNYFEDLQYDVNAKKESINEIKEKFKSIATSVKITTPFQLLKHLFGLKGYEQGIFEMAGCYLIFDEIHAYNPDVFAQIKVLLEFATKYLQAKVMIMTATMPQFLQAEIEESIGGYNIVKANKELYNSFKRHRVTLEAGLLSDNLDKIKIYIENGEKVLVVCNTVKSSQNVFAFLKNLVNHDEAVLLHGSFTGKDRSKKEKPLLNDNVKLLVGTQAIEVSLDIDYDIIFTEPAPIDALLQRFGRVNRKRKKGICSCVVFKDNNKNDLRIYNENVIKKTLDVLQEILIKYEGIIDEELLQDAINTVYPGWEEADKNEFDLKYKYLSESLLLLSPMFKNKHTEDEFYQQFDGIKILPQSKRSEFEECISRFDFITAESLKVQISKKRFSIWKQSQNIKMDIYAFQAGKKANTIPYYVTNKVYHDELGLLADFEEPWQTTEFL